MNRERDTQFWAFDFQIHAPTWHSIGYFQVLSCIPVLNNKRHAINKPFSLCDGVKIARDFASKSFFFVFLGFILMFCRKNSRAIKTIRWLYVINQCVFFACEFNEWIWNWEIDSDFLDDPAVTTNDFPKRVEHIDVKFRVKSIAFNDILVEFRWEIFQSENFKKEKCIQW